MLNCVIGTEKYPYAGIFSNYDDEYFTEGYGQIKEAFRVSTKVDVLQPYISFDNFRSCNVRADDVVYNLYVFDIRRQQNFTAAQPIEVEFTFDGVAPHDVNGYAFVLTNKLVSKISDGQWHFDLI